jgi:hypothetical protein
MALVNPNIAMSYRPTVEYQPRNALAEAAQIQQIMGGQRQAEMADMQMEALRRKDRAISQIQAAAAKNGGPTDRREIARAYVQSGVPEFMQFGLTLEKDLDELDAFARIMGGGARPATGGGAQPAARGTTPSFPIAGKDVPMGTLGTGTFDTAQIGNIGLVAPQQPPVSAEDRAALVAAAGPSGLANAFRQPSQGPYTGLTLEQNRAYFQAPLEERAALERALPSMKIPGVFAGQVPPFSQLSRDLLSPETRAAQDLGYGPAAQANALAPTAPPENVNQLAAAGGAAAAAAAPSADPVAALRTRRDQLIALGTPRALQAAKSLDADIALMSKRVTASPGSVVLGPDGKVIYTAPEAEPSELRTMQQLGYPLTQAGYAAFRAAQMKESAPPSMVAEYTFAKTPEGGGFRGSYQDFVTARAAAGRAPVQPVAPTITTVEDPTKPGSFLQVDARTYRGGGAGSPGVIGGARPSAAAEKTAAQRAQLSKDLDFAISELSNITKDGGLIDQSTGSGAGRLVDIGAGFVGQATKGAIAIGKIAPVADLALKMIPRFEGPQSDKDTASYKEAAGQLADPTLPTQIRKEAGRTVLRLMRERKNQFVTRDMAAEGAASSPAPASGALTPAEQAELDRLRSRFGGGR